MARDHRTSQIEGTGRDLELVPVSRILYESGDGTAAHGTGAEDFASPSAPRARRLIADQRYFGLAARPFRAGAQRMQARIVAQGPGNARIDLDSLGMDFLLEPAPSLGLLRAMLTGGLLVPDGTGWYRPTPRFAEWARAPLVAPLSRARARMLIDAVRESAAQVNAQWSRNPFEIRMVAVSGSYMSRSAVLPELSLWLILRPRPPQQGRGWRPQVTKGAGLRQILAAVSDVSSFLVVRIVAHRRVVPRPFAVVFQADEAVDTPVSATRRFREWGASLNASLGELLSAGSYSSGRRGRGR